MKEYIAEYIVPVEKKGNDYMFDFVNAKPLIRCKDCKHRVLIDKVWRCLYSDFIVPEHYCGYAERKE